MLRGLCSFTEPYFLSDFHKDLIRRLGMKRMAVQKVPDLICGCSAEVHPCVYTNFLFSTLRYRAKFKSTTSGDRYCWFHQDQLKTLAGQLLVSSLKRPHMWQSHFICSVNIDFFREVCGWHCYSPVLNCIQKAEELFPVFLIVWQPTEHTN